MQKKAPDSYCRAKLSPPGYQLIIRNPQVRDHVAKHALGKINVVSRNRPIKPHLVSPITVEGQIRAD